MEHPIREDKETYPDRGEKDGNGAKDSRGWCHARSFLSDIHQVDGDIQRGRNTVSLLRLLGLVCHGRNARKLGGGNVVEDSEPW